MIESLKLGFHDIDKRPLDIVSFLKPLHGVDVGGSLSEFKDEDRITKKIIKKEGKKDKIEYIRETAGFLPTHESEVSKLQNFLSNSGFMPRGKTEGGINGVFDYSTQASVRLFQEYVRTKDPNNYLELKPDGITGKKQTNPQIKLWQENNLSADWVDISSKKEKATPEFNIWIETLEKAKALYSSELNNNKILSKVEEFLQNTESATSKVKDWSVDRNDIHLIGIRRNENKGGARRANDDLFVLLINGMVFKFWGSTDPNYDQVKHSNNDDPFLVEGQHKYRFGWHQKTYRALRPYYPGVLVFRDVVDRKKNELTFEDIDSQEPTNNLSINIHWSGIGSYNFSAGCQVISGESYINHRDEVVKCGYAARNKGEFDKTNRKTKGAYNVLADLVVSFSKPAPKDINKPNFMYYTLGRDESLLKSNSDYFGKDYVLETLQRMNSGIK